MNKSLDELLAEQGFKSVEEVQQFASYVMPIVVDLHEQIVLWARRILPILVEMSALLPPSVDAGPGLLLSELLDESTLRWMEQEGRLD